MDGHAGHCQNDRDLFFFKMASVVGRLSERWNLNLQFLRHKIFLEIFWNLTESMTPFFKTGGTFLQNSGA